MLDLLNHLKVIFKVFCRIGGGNAHERLRKQQATSKIPQTDRDTYTHA